MRPWLLGAMLTVGSAACASAAPWKPAFDARCDCAAPAPGAETATEQLQSTTAANIPAVPVGLPLNATIADAPSSPQIVSVIETEILDKDLYAKPSPDKLVALARPLAESEAVSTDVDFGPKMTSHLRDARAARDAARANGDELNALLLEDSLWSAYRSSATRLQEQLERAILAAFARCGEFEPDFDVVVTSVISRLQKGAVSDLAALMPHVRRELSEWLVPGLGVKCAELARPLAPGIAGPLVARRAHEWLTLIKS